MDLQGHSPPLSHIGTPSSSHTFHMHSIYFHCSEAKHHLHYACWISPCFIDQQKNPVLDLLPSDQLETPVFPNSKLLWLGNKRIWLVIAQCSPLSTLSSNNVKITNSSDMYRKSLMRDSCIALIILPWYVVRWKHFLSSARSNHKSLPLRAAVMARRLFRKYGACTDPIYLERIMTSWVFWLRVINWLWCHKHGSLNSTRFFDLNRYLDCLTTVYTALQHIQDISQPVSTTLSNAPLDRLLSGCDCQPRLKLH